MAKRRRTALIEQETRDEATGKNPEALRRSREIRDKFLAVFGDISSIIPNDKNDRAIDIAKADGRGYIDMALESAKRRTDGIYEGMTTKQKEVFTAGYKGAQKGGLSAFPQNVGRLLVLFYSEEGDTVYDPFAGHNSRMELVYKVRRNYVGVDISKKFMEANYQIRDILLSENKRALQKNTATIELIEGSSHHVPQVPDESADFCITSPPYWDIEDYGDEPEQLGKANRTYDDFMDAMGEHIKESFRILKSGAYACWNVNDFNRNSIFYPYHADLYYYFREAGFLPHAVYIIDHIRTLASVFVQLTLNTKRFPKRHEYVLVFKKPDGTETVEKRRVNRRYRRRVEDEPEAQPEPKAPERKPAKTKARKAAPKKDAPKPNAKPRSKAKPKLPFPKKRRR